MHGAGPVLRTFIGRASTWQLLLIAIALIALGALLVAFGHVRGGIVGIVGVLLLLGAVRRSRGRHNTVRRVEQRTAHTDQEQP